MLSLWKYCKKLCPISFSSTFYFVVLLNFKLYNNAPHPYVFLDHILHHYTEECSECSFSTLRWVGLWTLQMHFYILLYCYDTWIGKSCEKILVFNTLFIIKYFFLHQFYSIHALFIFLSSSLFFFKPRQPSNRHTHKTLCYIIIFIEKYLYYIK